MKIHQITERAKHAKAKDKKPKLNKPNKGNESPHPMQGKMVGEMYDQPVKDITVTLNKNKKNYFNMQMLVKYAVEMGFSNLNDLKKPENLDKVIATMQQDGIDVMEQMQDFGGKYIDQDFMDLVKLMKGKGQGSTQELASNLLSFLSFAINDPKFGKLPLAKFGDNIKLVYNQYNANQSFDQHEKDREEFKKFDTPPAMRQPEESLEYNSLEESVGKFITEEEFDQLAEKQDACYHKVKSRYKVWPSAYASGALVKCRKVGAKNWGNSKKKKKKKSKG